MPATATAVRDIVPRAVSVAVIVAHLWRALVAARKLSTVRLSIDACGVPRTLPVILAAIALGSVVATSVAVTRASLLVLALRHPRAAVHERPCRPSERPEP